VDFNDHAGTPAGERGAAALFELRAAQGSIFLMNLHLASPHAALLTFKTDGGRKLVENIDRRERESEVVLGAAQLARGPLLLAGDFNTTDDSRIFREYWSEFADAFHRRGLGIGYTYLINHTQLRIDHILTDDAWHVHRCWVGPAVGSPHRPLIADLMYR
jgi:vancomycin resistance protein VanJ